MSSSAFLLLNEPLPIDAWVKFCKKWRLEYSAKSVSKTIWYVNGMFGVEVSFNQSDRTFIRFSTFHRGPQVENVAALAVLAWKTFSGRLEADPDVAWFVAEKVTSEGAARMATMTDRNYDEPKKDVFDGLSDAQLKAELKRREEERLAKATAEAFAENDAFVKALRGGNLVDALARKHDRTSCSDEKPTNNSAARGYPDCTRCFLLSLKSEEWSSLDYDLKPTFRFERRER